MVWDNHGKASPRLQPAQVCNGHTSRYQFRFCYHPCRTLFPQQPNQIFTKTFSFFTFLPQLLTKIQRTHTVLFYHLKSGTIDLPDLTTCSVQGCFTDLRPSADTNWNQICEASFSWIRHEETKVCVNFTENL